MFKSIGTRSSSRSAAQTTIYEANAQKPAKPSKQCAAETFSPTTRQADEGGASELKSRRRSPSAQATDAALPEKRLFISPRVYKSLQKYVGSASLPNGCSETPTVPRGIPGETVLLGTPVGKRLLEPPQNRKFNTIPP